MKHFFLCLGIMLSMAVAANSSEPESKNNVSGKMYFSDKPFGETNAGYKTSFTSNQFIYGRLELQGSTIKEAFKLKEPTKEHPYYYLAYDASVYRDGEQIGNPYSRNYFMLSAEDLNRSWINFDVLPEPSKSTRLFSLLEDFGSGLGFFPAYHLVDASQFPESGKYSMHIKIYSRSTNDWGTREDMDKWPFVQDEFEFNFRTADISLLKKNKELATAFSRENAFRYDKLPAVFSNPAKLTDPKVTTAKIAAILKRDLPHRTILKFVVEKTTGTLWTIAKDDFGLPKYRYLYPHVHAAYKMNGKCYVGVITLREVYEGGGRYGPLQVAFTSASNSGGDRGIDCVKIK